MSFRIDLRLRVGRLDLEVALEGAAEPVALVGPNGSGKSTLLRAIAGAHGPLSGTIEVGGRVVLDTARGIDLPPERRRVGYVPQGLGLFPHLDVLDNVAFGALASGVDRAERRRAARTLLAELGGEELAHRRPRSLSGGEAQRVALARALMVDPALLLFDEPLSALDVGARRRVRTFLAERLRRLGRASIIVTHDLRDLQAFAARVVVLEEGRVVQAGPLDELARRPATEFVAELVALGRSASPLAAAPD